MSRTFIQYAETKLILAAALLICLCAGSAYGLHQHLRSIRADTETLVRGNLHARHITALQALLQDAETGQRGFLLTGRTDYLEPYTRALTQIDQSIATLQADYVHTDLARSVVVSITQEVSAKLAELKETIEVRTHEGFEAAQQIVLNDTGKRAMQDLRIDLAQLLEAERSAIDRAAASQRALAQRDVGVGIGLTLGAVLPIIFFLLLAIRDTRRGRRESARLSHISSHDPLTGLLNRAALMSQLDEALSRRPKQIGLLYLDLDGFKAINDTHGHAAGDRVLIEVAKRLQDLVRRSDAVARLGGDEFVILIKDCPSRIALNNLAIQIEKGLDNLSLPGLQERRIGGSVGTAFSAEDGTWGMSLMATADAAMYARKAQGRVSRPARFQPRLVPVTSEG